MPVRSYKKNNKKSIVAGSPAIEEHEQMMDAMNQEQPETVQQPQQRQQVGVFSSQQFEPQKNVQTRVPLSVYEKLNRMKYFTGQHTSIGDIVLQAINEYVERHPI